MNQDGGGGGGRCSEGMLFGILEANGGYFFRN